MTTPAPPETLRVQNFAGMKDVTLELSRMNVLIGPSASGKSVCAKLLFFFKGIFPHVILNGFASETNDQLLAKDLALFLKYFPPKDWGTQPFTIKYTIADYQVTVTGNKKATQPAEVSYSASYANLLNASRSLAQALREQDIESGKIRTVGVSTFLNTLVETAPASAVTALLRPVYYIASGRAFFSLFRNVMFSLDPETFDPFLWEVGRAFQAVEVYHRRAKGWRSYGDPVDAYIQEILSGRYFVDDTGEYIVHDDGRRVALRNTSSGQQEAMPLVLSIAELTHGRGKSPICLFAEEPEAHLYPTAQRDVVHLMAAVTDLFKGEGSSQYVLTTHSPYILSALNNLMYGGKIVKETPDKKDKVTAVLPEAVLVDPANVRAYMMEDGKATSIIRKDTGLIVASEIDGVSDDIGREFNALLDVEFEDEDKAAA